MDTTFANLVNSAPAALNQLSELANALANDANYATTVQNQLALKAPLANPTFTGTTTLGTVNQKFLELLTVHLHLLRGREGTN